MALALKALDLRIDSPEKLNSIRAKIVDAEMLLMKLRVDESEERLRLALLVNGESKNLNLSTRERQVLDLVVNGYSNKEIGARLNITARTAKFHVSALLMKHGVPDRYQLTRMRTWFMDKQ